MTTEPPTASQRAELADQLRVERAEIERRRSGLVTAFDELVDSADLQPPDDEHDPDGTTAYERAQVISLARECDTRLAAIDRALASIDDDRFGTCPACGQPIGLARLHALPGTDRCVTCAASGR